MEAGQHAPVRLATAVPYDPWLVADVKHDLAAFEVQLHQGVVSVDRLLAEEPPFLLLSLFFSND